MACGCCERLRFNKRTCGSKQHPCQKVQRGLPCDRLDAIRTKEIELTELRERREREFNNNLYADEEDLTDSLEAHKCIRLTARNCLAFDTIPGKYPLNAIHEAALSQARKLMPPGQLYVGLSKHPLCRLKQHKLFSHMIVIGKTIDADIAISVEKFLIKHLGATKDLLNSSIGGEGVDRCAPWQYVYLGYGTDRALRA